MKVFISVKVPRGTLDVEQLINLVEEQTLAAGHVPFVAYREIRQHGLEQAEQFMPFVREQMRSSDLVIILYDPELRGGLIEEGLAYAFRIPIWLLHRAGGYVSSSALGCADLVISYDHDNDLKARLVKAFHEPI